MASWKCWGLLALTACGRVQFDPLGDAGDGDARAPDGPVDDASTPGLIAYWPFDEGTGTAAADVVGIAEGTIDPGVTWTTGAVGSALSFPGTAAVVRLVAPDAIHNLPALTISAYLNATNAIADGFPHCYFGNGDVNLPAGWAVFVGDDTNGDIAFGSFYPASVIMRRISVGGLVAPGVWNHIVITWDGSILAANVHIYFNGAEVAYATTSDGAGVRPDDSGVTPVVIGCRSPTSFAGIQDEVKIFNRVLSLAEIQAL